MIKPSQWQPSEGLALEPNALAAAIEIERSLVLTAGPGAGKTEMLAQRAGFLLRTGTCRYPQRILAISFKVDASKNLKERVRRRCGPELASRLDSYTFHGFAKRLIDRFRPVLTGDDALDADYTVGDPRVHRRQIGFLDMVPLAIDILRKSPMARNAVRQTYSHVFLDEFQDCTGFQYELICAAFKGTHVNVTAVGDVKQSIMAWAGALDGVFQRFASDFSAISLNLYQNFRSQPRLRRMQNAMVKVMDPAAAVPDEQIAQDAGSVEVLSYSDCQKEADALAATIQKWISNENIAPSDIAVLVSRQVEHYAARLMLALDRLGISYRNEVSLQDLSTEPVARLIVDFLLVVVGEYEPDAYRRLMEVLLDVDADEVEAYGTRLRWRLFIDDSRQRFRQNSLQLVDADVLRELATGFLQSVGVQVLRSLSADYEHGGWLDEVTLNAFQRIGELLRAGQGVVVALSRFSEDGNVRLMTIHKSKGLEFDSVVMLGVEKETFWGKLVEERSAFFVGISRAKRRLVLSVVAARERPSGMKGRWDVVRTPHKEFLGYVADAK
ncbi:ATP-dependent helicase [Corallococcus sp. CA054B]|uniref:UvrD-helicase domain-containing protein n=1 Tax=Corallococcus sp. CA054B TaxID=2316734 RepID=UPI000EA24477|nr:ATP-dependent helicase [Corallococcus sp. CA054B]RKG67801.1 ATP-dependent helicase [Corallococcus sp. CA054B]